MIRWFCLLLLCASTAVAADHHITIGPDYSNPAAAETWINGQARGVYAAQAQAEFWAENYQRTNFAAGQQIVINPYCTQPASFQPQPAVDAVLFPPLTPDELSVLQSVVAKYPLTKLEIVVGNDGRIAWTRRTSVTPEEAGRHVSFTVIHHN